MATPEKIVAPIGTAGKELAGGLAPGPNLRFGYYETLSPGTSYVAQSDGFVCAGLSAPGDASNFNLSILRGVVDGQVMASATAGNFGCFDSKWNYVRASGTASFLMPVPKGAMWRVDTHPHDGSEATVTAWVNWLPLAVNPSEPNQQISAPTRLDHPQVMRKPWEDFDPAINNLVDLLAKLFNQRLTEAEKEILAAAMKQLI